MYVTFIFYTYNKCKIRKKYRQIKIEEQQFYTCHVYLMDSLKDFKEEKI